MTDSTNLEGRLLEAERALRELQRGVSKMQLEFGDLGAAYTKAAARFVANRRVYLAEELEAALGLEAKRELLKSSDAEFLAKLGAASDRLQREVDALLANLASALDIPALPALAARRDMIGELFESEYAKDHRKTWPDTDAPRDTPY